MLCRNVGMMAAEEESKVHHHHRIVLWNVGIHVWQGTKRIHSKSDEHTC
jgi:hypothetical protein